MVVSMTKERIPNRCMAPAPEALTGHLGVLKCRLETRADGTHEGYHKASRTITSIGKIVVRWRQGPTGRPPEISLPTTAGATLNSRAAYRG